jgi:phospho-N-acetylmuramoyl-pentapeptide-transferase
MTSAFVALLLAFLLGIVAGPPFIRLLIRLRLGKQIRLEGQEHHLAKQGTPTMGGVLFVSIAAAVTVALAPDPASLLPYFLAIGLFALFGALDDVANIRSHEGIGFKIRAQLLWQLIFAAIVAVLLYLGPAGSAIRIPFVGAIELGIAFVPFAVFVIYATTSAANVIDGLDGLAGGTIGIAIATFGVLALGRGQVVLAVAAAALVGSLLAFLWFNVHPARVFMGGTGSLGLGAALAVLALGTGDALLLPVVAAPLVLVLVSVMLQVGYFRLTGGRRLFRRAPFHHHLELIGWPETQIVGRFWIAAAVAGACGLLLVRL